MPLEDRIRNEIKRQGAISFARFMEFALYHPKLGYYEQLYPLIGKSGDFFTSVSTGPFFGELLARQFARWTSQLFSPRIQCLECGAHDGRLAFDILQAWRELNLSHWDRLDYWILEPSDQRRTWQKSSLREFAGHVRWFTSWDEIPVNCLTGIIFSNELLDAFPVHRMGWDAKIQAWFEWGVDWLHGRFSWTRLPSPDTSLRPGLVDPAFPSNRQLPPELAAVLPHCFTTEVCPAADCWWRAAAQRLQAGYLMCLDYGLEDLDFFQPSRANGTLQSYYRHHLTNDPLLQVGQQDLTSQVNFTSLQALGESAGLKTSLFKEQTAFLVQILGNDAGETNQSLGGTSSGWSQKQTRQFKTLIHPEHLGRSHRALVQERLAAD
jgi:SAM-dependent MidA family methyltransferase